jgi:hypothetical protein
MISARREPFQLSTQRSQPQNTRSQKPLTETQKIFIKKSFVAQTSMSQPILLPPTQMIKSHYGCWIDGKEVEAAGGRKFEVREPATGALVATVAEGDAEDIMRAFDSAQQAFDDGRWVNVSPRDKCRILFKAAQLLRERLEYIIEVEVRSTGRAIKEMRAQIPRVTAWLEYFGSVVQVRQNGLRKKFGSNFFFGFFFRLSFCRQYFLRDST